MGRDRNQRRKKRGSLTVKKTKVKQRDYTSDGASITTNMYAFKTERLRMIGMLVLEFLGFIGGIILICCNVRDEDFCLEFSNFKFQCSLAGVAITIISIYALIKTNPKINIKNEK